jgi:hypothetical protein
MKRGRMPSIPEGGGFRTRRINIRYNIQWLAQKWKTLPITIIMELKTARKLPHTYVFRFLQKNSFSTSVTFLFAKSSDKK